MSKKSLILRMLLCIGLFALVVYVEKAHAWRTWIFNKRPHPVQLTFLTGTGPCDKKVIPPMEGITYDYGPYEYYCTDQLERIDIQDRFGTFLGTVFRKELVLNPQVVIR